MNDIDKSEAQKEKESEFKRYEALIIKRDHLLREAADIEAQYYHEFGKLSVELFDKKLECIKWKKIISYCQAAANTGRSVKEDELDTYIRNSTAEYEKQLCQLVDMRNSTETLKSVPAYVAQKAKRKYRDIAKKIHPDIHPDLAGNQYFEELWQAAAEAYQKLDLQRLEEIEALAQSALVKLGKGEEMPHIPDIGERIKNVQEQIDRIISTDPYLFKFLLDDPEAVSDRMHDMNQELGEYTSYGLMLEGVVEKMMGKEFAGNWKMKIKTI